MLCHSAETAECEYSHHWFVSNS